MATKRGIVLLNMGGPRTLDEIRPFLFNLFKDPDIIPVPWWLRWLRVPIAWIIAKFRAPKSAHAYEIIGGGSPLAKTCQSMADKLAAKLNDGTVTTVAMRYWHPFADEAVKQLLANDINEVIMLPLYPQYSTTTSMSSFRDFFAHADKLGFRPDRVFGVRSYCRDDGYVKLSAELLQQTVAQVPSELRDSAHILFSAHSIPLDRVKMGDPYPQEVADSMQRIVAAANTGLPHSLAYQSKVGPVEWLGPQVDDALVELAASGVKAVVIVPIAFTSDHVETLEEIDIGYAEVAAEHGIDFFQRVPTFNDDDRYIDVLHSLIDLALDEPQWRNSDGKCRNDCLWRKGDACVCFGS